MNLPELGQAVGYIGGVMFLGDLVFRLVDRTFRIWRLERLAANAAAGRPVLFKGTGGPPPPLPLALRMPPGPCEGEGCSHVAGAGIVCHHCAPAAPPPLSRMRPPK